MMLLAGGPPIRSHRAINSVRGRAFEAYIRFVLLHGEEIGSDVKELYEGVLQRENTRALMFMFGRYCFDLLTSATRIGLENYLPQIFPQNPDKEVALFCGLGRVPIRQTVRRYDL